jgi:hypothetical protein
VTIPFHDGIQDRSRAFFLLGDPMKARSFALLALVMSVGCSSNQTQAPANGQGSGGAAAGGNAETGGAQAGATGAGGGGAAAPDVAPAGSGGAAGGTDAGMEVALSPADGNPADGTNPVALPAGSRDLLGVVNLVDDRAAKQLEQFILDDSVEQDFLRQGLTQALNLLIDSYFEEYDFVYFFTDHPVSGSTIAGKFEAVNRPARAGGGNDVEIAAGGYKSTGRTKGVIAIPYETGYYPPLAHETLHWWAVHLDKSFGFGKGLSQSFFAHWGYANINGQLGGYDGATLRCETPAGSSPPACTALASGRYRYVLGAFAPNTNGFRDVAYAPIELYLMGLAPPEEVPASIQQLTDADLVAFSDDFTSATVEAAGISTLAFADILARHGTMAPIPAADRHFTSAFVVLSSAPAADSVLTEVAHWAAVFGGRETVKGWKSFSGYTSGRASMTTALGPRRDQSTPPPPVRERFACNALAQDCGRPELACRVAPPSFCGLVGTGQRGQPCTIASECAKGLNCLVSICEPFCDASNTTSPSSCQVLCPGNYGNYRDTSGAVVASICRN